jgi:hypothetical protein
MWLRILALVACNDEGSASCPDGDCPSTIPTDQAPPTQTIPEDRDGRCDLFCAASEEVCPQDTACLHSCSDVCPEGPSEQDVYCAQDAAASGLTCADFDCWGFCS